MRTLSVFFSFHYEDIERVKIVKALREQPQHPSNEPRGYVGKVRREYNIGFFNGSLEEEAKTKGDKYVQHLIDEKLKDADALCVLIGQQTHTRRWVRYEIFKAIEMGLGVIGVYIHQIKIASEAPISGRKPCNPFTIMRYQRVDGILVPMVKARGSWHHAPRLQPLNWDVGAEYMNKKGLPEIILDDPFATYDWIRDKPEEGFSKWIVRAVAMSPKYVYLAPPSKSFPGRRSEYELSSDAEYFF